MRTKLVLLSALLLALITPASLHATNNPPDRILLLNLDLVSRRGGVLVTLTVYSDGVSILTQRDSDHPEGEICESTATPESLESLETTLDEARALFLPGLPFKPNSARVTINVFKSLDRKGHTFGNTFGYSTLEEPYKPIDNEVTNFINANFSNCE